MKTFREFTEAPRIARKKGQPAGSDKHSDLYTDENPKGTIHGLKFATIKDAEKSVAKIEKSGKKHPIAKDLRTPKYRKRIVKDKTKYDRKNIKRKSPFVVSNGILAYVIQRDVE